MLRNPFRQTLWALCALLLLSPACKSEKGPTKSAEQAEPVAAAQAPTEPKADEAPQAPAFLANPFFYKVEGKDGAGGHLLGTMHMGIDAKVELAPAIWDLLKGASILVTEADITDPSLAAGMMLPKDQNLRMLLGDEDWKLLEEKLGAMTAKMMMPMKPSAAAATLAMKGLPMTMPMDLLLISTARDNKVELDYLETGAFQMDLLNTVMNLDFLKHLLKTEQKEDSKELLKLYRNGDGERLFAKALEPDAWGPKPGNIDLMLYKRNADWIPKLEGFFAKKNAFVGMGAAHLFGPKGVLALLEAKGFTVTRVVP